MPGRGEGGSREAVSSAASGDGLYLRNDGQLCEEVISGIEGNFIRNGIFSDSGE